MAVAPWAMAFGMLVSITAQADQEMPTTSNVGMRYEVASATVSPWGVIPVKYFVGSADELSAISDDIEPNASLKPAHSQLPVINESGKGDPFIVLRPGFDARTKRGASGEAKGEPDWPADWRSPVGKNAEPPRSEAHVVYGDGATPSLPMAFALISATPRPTDTKLAVAGSSRAVAPPQTTVVNVFDDKGQPDYANLVDAKDSTRQMRCLAEAIYFEARSEPEAGQAAVAQVVLNRVRSGIFPTNVCGVVYQDANRPFACQFSFACEGKSLRIEEPGSWATATRIADEVVKGANYNAKLIDAVNYHANYVYPFWAPSLRRVDKIGAHIFYAMKPGLYWAPGALNGRGDLPPLQASAR